MIINFTIREHLNLISNNDMYMPRPCRGGRSAYITKTGALRKFEEHIDALLVKLVTDEQIEQLQEELDDYQTGLRIEMNLGMSSIDYYRRDASDCIKTVEDALKFRLKVDDVRNTEVEVKKYIFPDSTDDKDWNIEITISTNHNETILEDKWIKGTKGIKGKRGNTGR